MQLHVNPGDELPIYRQIMRQIIEAVAVGRLRPGDKLASHRELAESLVIAPLTVKKAYDELEQEGYLDTQRGRGTFVAKRLPSPDPVLRWERMRETARRLATQAVLYEVTLEEAKELVESEYHALPRGRESGEADEEGSRS
jgi:GntR family transcriptional regulator